MVFFYILFIFFQVHAGYDYALIRDLENKKPEIFAEFIDGVVKKIHTDKKIIALTLDACSGKYDSEMIQFLEENQVPATLFVTGKWIDNNVENFKILVKSENFEIENHGLNHKPLTVMGQKIYGIQGSTNIYDAFDEINKNAEKIQSYTGERPIFYRSGTAYYDNIGIEIAKKLDHTIMGFDVVSSDAKNPKSSAKRLAKNIISSVDNGSVVIIHMNHPEWNGAEALKIAIPKLRSQGYEFVLLKDYKNSLEF